MRDTHKHILTKGRGRGVFTCVMLNCMAMLIGGHKTLGQLRSTEAEQSTLSCTEHADYPYLNIN